MKWKVFMNEDEEYFIVDAKTMKDVPLNEKNANLIAAAPELLESLKECLEYLNAADADIQATIIEANQKILLLGALNLLRLKAERVIAKAEGK